MGPNNCDTGTKKMITDFMDISFIHGDIQGKYKNAAMFTAEILLLVFQS